MSDYGDEFVLHLANGHTIRTSTFADHPEGADYVRVCRPDGTELAYWDSEEWRDNPQLVIGAFLGCAAAEPPEGLGNGLEAST